MKGVIYHAFDTTNGLAYVGQTCLPLHERKRLHSRKGNKTYFGSALNKRPDSFIWSVLCECEQEKLDEAEDAFIVELNTLYPGGYNFRRGGASGKFGLPHSVEHKKNLGDSIKRAWAEGRKTGRKARTVEHVESGRVFSCVSDAAKALGISDSMVYLTCNNKVANPRNLLKWGK